MMIGGMFGGGNFCHVESMYRYFADPLIKLKKYAETNGQQEDVALYSQFLTQTRQSIEHLQSIIPGSVCAGGVAIVAMISASLGDRDLNDELKKMETAIQTAIEMKFLPVDVCVLKKTIGYWQ